MSAPVPGSSEDYAARKRQGRAVGWAVMRGRQMSSPAEARLAVEMAQKSLDELWKVRRYGLIGTAFFVLFAVAHSLAGDVFFSVVFGVLAFLQVLMIVYMNGPARRRYERAIELNAPLAEPAGSSPDTK